MVFQERTYSVLVVSSSAKFNSTALDLLPVTDYFPVTTVGSIAEAKRQVLDRRYDIVLINAPLPDDLGLHFAIDICQSSSAGVLLLVKNELYNEVYTQAVSYGVMTLAKPTSLQMVAQSLRVLCATRERLRHMEARQTSVEEKIEEIRLVNRAKWLLIEKQAMTEEAAHRHIEKQAMDLRLAKREVARQIIDTCK